MRPGEIRYPARREDRQDHAEPAGAGAVTGHATSGWLTSRMRALPIPRRLPRPGAAAMWRQPRTRRLL